MFMINVIAFTSSIWLNYASEYETYSFNNSKIGNIIKLLSIFKSKAAYVIK